jgi:hypothetical protein
MRRLFYLLFCLVFIGLLLAGTPVRVGQAAALQTPRAFLPILLHGTLTLVNLQPPVTLQSFITSVQNGGANTVMGVYVQDVLAQLVAQQPANDYAYISLARDQVTQFSLAQAPVVGLIAHIELAGNKFSGLTTGQELYLVLGNGRALHYQVSRIASYQAVNPASPTSSFVDLATGQTLSAAKLFALYYLGQDHV